MIDDMGHHMAFLFAVAKKSITLVYPIVQHYTQFVYFICSIYKISLSLLMVFARFQYLPFKTEWLWTLTFQFLYPVQLEQFQNGEIHQESIKLRNKIKICVRLERIFKV